MKRFVITCATTVALSCALAPVGASAADPPGPSWGMQGLGMTLGAIGADVAAILGPDQTGQPDQTCGSPTAPNTPGNAAQAPGSAFNPSGQAGSVYAGEQPQNSRNAASVSQYDVACSRQR